jgi:hypothetical protein
MFYFFSNPSYLGLHLRQTQIIPNQTSKLRKPQMSPFYRQYEPAEMHQRTNITTFHALTFKIICHNPYAASPCAPESPNAQDSPGPNIGRDQRFFELPNHIRKVLDVPD